MRIGVPKEIKNHEYRVGLTPTSVQTLVRRGHTVIVESGAGAGINKTDEDYLNVGAEILPDAETVFRDSELIIKVKEPQLHECEWLREGQTLFTYLHLAAFPEQAGCLLESGVTAIAFETVTAPNGSLPLLAPMSEVAGRLSVQAGVACLEKPNGGCGVLLGGVPGVAPGKVLIIGGGIVGCNAAMIACGMGAEVTIVDTSLEKLRQIAIQFGTAVKGVFSTPEAIAALARDADLVIGAVLIPGAKAPKLLTADMVRTMKKGSVVVDVAIDQGGCFETSKPTTHDAATYLVDHVIHYCVTNMPGAVPITSTNALNNALMPFVAAIADHGVSKALSRSEGLMQGLNINRGNITNAAVADALSTTYCSPASTLQ